MAYIVPDHRRQLLCRMRNLNGPERAVLTNGCGGKGGWINPPDFMYTASCDHHDFNYWLGYTEADRKAADRKFYAAMIKDCRRAPWYKRPFYRAVAWLYYRAVRLCGKRFFHYRELAPDEAASEEFKNNVRWARLEIEMTRAGWSEEEARFD